MSVQVAQSEVRPLVLCLGPLRHKMTDEEFFAFCGANPDLRIEKKVYVYHPGEQVACLEHADCISGEPLLRGFTLHLQPIWG